MNLDKKNHNLVSIVTTYSFSYFFISTCRLFTSLHFKTRGTVRKLTNDTPLLRNTISQITVFHQFFKLKMIHFVSCSLSLHKLLTGKVSYKKYYLDCHPDLQTIWGGYLFFIS